MRPILPPHPPGWIALLVTLLLAACGEPVATASGGDAAQLLVGGDAPTHRTDLVEIRRAAVHQDELRLQLEFAGGCAEHDFALSYSGAFMESHPVQTTLTLAHDAHGDACRALFSREIAFDLTPIKRAYQKAYAEHGAILIHLRAPTSSTTPAPSVQYEF